MSKLIMRPKLRKKVISSGLLSTNASTELRSSSVFAFSEVQPFSNYVENGQKNLHIPD